MMAKSPSSKRNDVASRTADQEGRSGGEKRRREEEGDVVMPKARPNSEQVLEVLYDVLREHMGGPEHGPSCHVRRAVRIGDSGKVLTGEEIIAGMGVPVGLLLTMADGTSTS